MSVIGSNILAGASGQGGGYTIDRSVRLRSSASAYFNRTTTSTVTSNTTWSFSAWLKIGSQSTSGAIFETSSSGTTGIPRGGIRWDGANALELFQYNGTSYDYRQITTLVFRDPSAWYHIVVVADTSNGTAANRMKLYVNNVQGTSWSTNTQPSSGLATYIGSASKLSRIGVDTYNGSSAIFDGYLTEINFIDGQALDPTSFGEYNADTGVWQAKKYAGTYGTNGFFLNFSDNTSTTTLGYDTSGNGNNWTANNISLTSGVTYDSMTDVPTLTSEDAANYAVLNPLDKYSSTIGTSEANLKLISTSGGSFQQLRNSVGMSSGKHYMEWVIVSLGAAGRTGAALIRHDSTLAGASTSTTTSWCYSSTGDAYANNVTTSLSTGAITTGTDVVMYAFDADTGKFWMGKNGTWANSGDPATGANPIYSGLTNGPYFFGGWNYNTSDVVAFNFGQRPFAYTPPTGFKSLNTFNLPDATIKKGNQYFDVSTWTGDGSFPRNITNSGSMQPDFVWVKTRSLTRAHTLFDSVRGFGLVKELASDQTYAEGGLSTSLYGAVTAATSNGFTAGTGSTNGDYVNKLNDTYVGWQWKANGAGVSNTDGSITSTVSANTTSGFSIVTYTGTGSTATVGHGLGVAPSMVIVKQRGIAGNWWVWHASLNGLDYGLNLNGTAAQSLVTNLWGSLPTSTVFGHGSAWGSVTQVAYCFAEVPGYSKFGSYTGNGSADGPFVFCGFRPRYVMIKRTDSVGQWGVLDTSRNTYNTLGNLLIPSSSAAEDTTYLVDLLSNGFKPRVGAGYGINDSGGTYVYACFAENPFKNSLAR